MWMVLGVLLAALLQSVSSQDQLCPTLPGQLGQPQDLNTSSINLFIDLDCKLTHSKTNELASYVNHIVDMINTLFRSLPQLYLMSLKMEM